ncbi:g8350 [Coccomyxa viridis]|uniref:G8350 protein n=1 Tax=Coccomyxa viridis TaxID=1274662 RepID=A0ABP1G071_9CHLO
MNCKKFLEEQEGHKEHRCLLRSKKGPFQHTRKPLITDSRRSLEKRCRLAARSQRHGTVLAPYTVSDVDLSFDGWGEHGIREAENEEALSVDDLIDLADSCARQLHGEQELLTLHASLSHGEEHACSLDGSGCGPEMPEPASQACRLQDLDFDRSMDSWPQSHFAMVLWGAGVEQLAHDRQLAQQILGVLAPGGVLLVPVRSSGRLILSSRAQPMASSDFARQLLYSAGFEDIRAAQLTRLPEFSQTLPGDVMLAMGKRPGTAQGLAAAKQASGLGYASRASIALTDLSNREGLSDAVQERWLFAYREMTEEAISLGIPKTALPKLSEKTSVEELQDARIRLSGMIASFMSSGL